MESSRLVVRLGKANHVCSSDLRRAKQCLSCGRGYYGHHRSIYCSACSSVKDTVGHQRYRAGKHGVTTHFTPVEWLVLVGLAGGFCVACNQKGMLVPDHIISLYLGGKNTIDNIQPVCLSCNSKKGDRAVDYRPLRVRKLIEKWLRGEIEIDYTED